MRRTYLADQAARSSSDIRVVVRSVSRTVELKGSAQVRMLENGLRDEKRVKKAWRKNGSCVTCTNLIEVPADAGVLAIEGIDRVAHRRNGCFAAAVVDHCVRRELPIRVGVAHG